MSEHHSQFAPSSFPALRECPCFRGGVESDAASRGTFLHEAFALMLKGEDAPDGVEPDELAGLEWARDYVDVHRDSDAPLEVEQRVEFLGEDFEVIYFGTADAIGGAHFFDLKTGRKRDTYRYQMLGYAAAIMQRDSLDNVTVHELYSAIQYATSYNVQDVDALSTINDIIATVHDPDKQPQPCDFCNWCADAATCPALNERALAVMDGRDDWALENYATSEILAPSEMAKALALAKQLEQWCKSVTYHAKELAKNGVEIPGWEERERTVREIKDLPEAWKLSGIPQEEFLKCCKVKLGDLEKAYAKAHDIKPTPAKKRMAEALDAVTKTTTQRTLSAVKKEAVDA
ncbi:MAG: DUF2800 domain-containing protein [bacterium]|nr:DUF2800 domain-containing protein [bacterium]